MEPHKMNNQQNEHEPKQIDTKKIIEWLHNWDTDNKNYVIDNFGWNFYDGILCATRDYTPRMVTYDTLYLTTLNQIETFTIDVDYPVVKNGVDYVVNNSQ